MNADLAAALAARWVRFYTRGLPVRVATARRDELASDLFEHRADDQRQGVSSSATGAAILGRIVLGAAADLGWRSRQIAALRSRGLATRPAGPSVVAVEDHSWLYQRLHTRRCKVCGEHYRRRLPNCPVCKTLKGNSDPDGASIWKLNQSSWR
jgi:hypothetical protein